MLRKVVTLSRKHRIRTHVQMQQVSVYLTFVLGVISHKPVDVVGRSNEEEKQDYTKGPEDTHFQSVLKKLNYHMPHIYKLFFK